jgi:PAS domain S-box-containing protein
LRVFRRDATWRVRFMRISTKRIGVIGGFAILLILLVGNGVVTKRRLDAQIDREFWVSHTVQVMLELKQTRVLLLEAETEKRGYLYTGDTEYLAPFNAAIAQIDPEIDTIARLTADNPIQQARIPWLRNLAHGKIVEMQQAIALYESGKLDAAKAVVLADTAQDTMVRINETIAAMDQEEIRLDAIRAPEYQKSIRGTATSIYLTSLIALLGLAALAYYILQDLNLRERHAQELHAREEWFRVTLTSIGDAVIATDKEGSVTFLNPVAEKLTGTTMERAKGKNIQKVFPILNELTHMPAENPVQKVLEVGEVVGLANHTVLQRQDGTQIPIEDSAAPIRGDQGELLGVVLVFRDVTNDRKAQESMSKSERLAAVARLSATMAHEINNPLQAVGSLVYLALSTPSVPPPVVEHLTLVDQELRRVAHITQQTLGFYRDSRVAEFVDMPAVVESVLALYSNKLRAKDIHVERHFGDWPPVCATSSEIKQVISNLVANAADAVGDQGEITVTLGRAEEAGRTMMQFLIEDDGPGVAAGLRQHVFEPFFTTKQDVGTGLGLWLSREIVNRYGGSIQLISRDQGVAGAAFSVLLPCAADAPKATDDGAAIEVQEGER